MSCVAVDYECFHRLTLSWKTLSRIVLSDTGIVLSDTGIVLDCVVSALAIQSG